MAHSFFVVEEMLGDYCFCRLYKNVIHTLLSTCGKEQ